MRIYGTPGRHLWYPQGYWYHSLRTTALDVLTGGVYSVPYYGLQLNVPSVQCSFKFVQNLADSWSFWSPDCA